MEGLHVSESIEDNEVLSNISRNAVGKLLKRVKKGFNKEDVGYLRHCESSAKKKKKEKGKRMITGSDLYHVMTAVVPLYAAMIVAYGSVKWWKIFTPEQCSGINRFAVPLLSFHFIASNNPYDMNFRFLAADTLQKLIVLFALGVWASLSKRGGLEWTITLFSLSTLPNTLVMGIPLLKGMYGDYSGGLMVQIVVLQCIIWYTLMLFMLPVDKLVKIELQ